MATQTPAYTSKSGRTVKCGISDEYEMSSPEKWDDCPGNETIAETSKIIGPETEGTEEAMGEYMYLTSDIASISNPHKRSLESPDNYDKPTKVPTVIDVRSLPCFPPPSRKQNMTLEEKVDLINAVMKKDKLRAEIAREYGITSSTLTGIMHQKDKILSAVSNGVISEKRKRLRKSNFEEVEDALYNWIMEVQDSEYHVISGPVLQQKAIEIAQELGYPNFRCSNGYLDRFKKRKGIRYSPKAKWKSVRKKIHEDFGDMNETVYNCTPNVEEHETSLIVYKGKPLV